MTRKLHTLSTVTALFAGLATAHGLPATAEAAPTGQTVAAQDVSPSMLSAMQRDLGLSEEQIHRRLAFEATAARVELRLSQELGSTFGGAWLNEDGSQLIVGVTDEASAALVRLAGAEPRRVARSKAQLDRVMDELDRNAANASASSIHTWYVDLPTNSVVVTAADSVMSKFQAENFIARTSGAKDGTIRVVRSAEAPRPLYDTRGGDAYYPGNARCSIGFAVNGGFVTAGHCGGVGTTTSGHNRVAQGTVRGSSFPGNDYGWVQTNGSWASQPWVNNYAGGNDVVSGSSEAGIGASICRSGSTTGKRCGAIQAKNVTVNYSNGPVYGLTQTNVCAEGGDSGGSWLSGNQAQGVTSGGSGNCTSGGTTFFQPLNPILSVYGLSLTTNGGGGGGKGFVSRLNGKCIDVPNSNFSDGVQLQMWDCNGTNAQKFTWVGSTLQIGGKCVDVANASTANGTPIQLVSCNGNRAQDFVLSGAGDLVSYLANKCVDIKDVSSASGAKLHLWDCNGAANQKWDYR
ncbi:streptogrisin C. Serine peptidase. MEROPS family S01A [Stigmatella aurantiaca]|uniref:Streptogrisin C. Serine peptidase. MEROPS family S01A n=1 Tax=Stigmatella aurantiaca TaxID=41 RepID=A0A1H7WKK5_STIAU|nr:S1 family peptidase [Stigmatella aurantiaca]SEM21665.1 streptogrisin C. Serine peptidase. MEROPS family S01A [Stigmatella aurantiaca]